MLSRLLSKLTFLLYRGAAALKGGPLGRTVVKPPERSRRVGAFYQGTLGVTNTVDASTCEITTNCSWGGTLANSGDTFHCAAYPG